DLRADHLGHAHATKFRRATYTHPAALGVGKVRLDKAGRGLYRAFVPGTAFFISATVERGDAARSDLAGLFQDRSSGLDIHDFGQTGELGPKRGHVEDFIEHKTHVAQGRLVISHVNLADKRL